MTTHDDVVVIGAGPAGLTAAYELVKQGLQPIVLEKTKKVGGLARTEIYNGYRFDIGGHRFFTKINEVESLWDEMLNGDFLKVPRLSHIHYQNRFFKYPLNFQDALTKLGIVESMMILLSYARARIAPFEEEKTFEQWVINRFGRRLYETFFKTYTEKVWGVRCDEIQSDWAAQRINGMSLKTVVSNALFGSNGVKSLIKEFQYPKHGPGMMWEKLKEAVESLGGQVQLDTEIIRIERNGDRIENVIIKCENNQITIPGKHFISSMPLNELVSSIHPAPPDQVLQSARDLRYRALIIAGLIVNRENLFLSNWLYVHNPDVKVGRIQNFKNWSRAMVPDQNKTSLGMEYFCDVGDDIWKMPDRDIIKLAAHEADSLGLVDICDVEDGVVFREPKAYPVYDLAYQKRLEVIRNYLSTLDNLQTIGRNGLHRYNNQDHSMLTAMLAVKNILGEKHDLWEVNTEKAHHENKSSHR